MTITHIEKAADVSAVHCLDDYGGAASKHEIASPVCIWDQKYKQLNSTKSKADI